MLPQWVSVVQLAKKEGGDGITQVYQRVSGCELLGCFTNLKKRAHIASELLGLELKAGNRKLLNSTFMLHEETRTHCMHI